MGEGNQRRPEAAQCIFLSQGFLLFLWSGKGDNRSRGTELTSQVARLKSHRLWQRRHEAEAGRNGGPVQSQVASHLVETRPNSDGILRAEGHIC